MHNLIFWGLFPLLVPQALYVKRIAPRLPPPACEPQGSMGEGEPLRLHLKLPATLRIARSRDGEGRGGEVDEHALQTFFERRRRRFLLLGQRAGAEDAGEAPFRLRQQLVHAHAPGAADDLDHELRVTTPGRVGGVGRTQEEVRVVAAVEQQHLGVQAAERPAIAEIFLVFVG